MTELIPVTEGVVELERISPEGLEVANSYLVTNNLSATARELGLPQHMVCDQLESPLVKQYINAVFMDSGYRNRNTLASTLDNIITQKLEEMNEAEVSSSKDISELLALAHKMRMEELRMQVESMKAEAQLIKAKQPASQGTTVNIQNNGLDGSKYGQLMGQLLGLDNAEKKS
jgi:hypothetical protein